MGGWGGGLEKPTSSKRVEKKGKKKREKKREKTFLLSELDGEFSFSLFFFVVPFFSSGFSVSTNPSRGLIFFRTAGTDGTSRGVGKRSTVHLNFSFIFFPENGFIFSLSLSSVRGAFFFQTSLLFFFQTESSCCSHSSTRFAVRFGPGRTEIYRVSFRVGFLFAFCGGWFFFFFFFFVFVLSDRGRRRAPLVSAGPLNNSGAETQKRKQLGDERSVE